MNRDKQPLYRKVNSTAHGLHHHKGPDASDKRHKMTTKMVRGAKRGLDYTPLYRFLLSKVGQDFDNVYSEAISRLDEENGDSAIFHMVIRKEDMRGGTEYPDYIISGESSYYSALYVDENNALQIVNPDFRNEHLKPSCNCCTHTFNGKVFVNKFREKVG